MIVRALGVGGSSGSIALTFGALFPTTCKYHPSCSEYAVQALRQQGPRARQPARRLAAAALQPVEPRRLRPGPMMHLLFAIPIISQLEAVMRHVLNFFHTNFGLPWAWAIVATTVLVRMLLVPLTVKQIHSMQNLQRHAPQMKEIQKKYKHDKAKQNEELMKFYRENNINPAASCLPMLAAAAGLHRPLLHAQALRASFRQAAHQNLSFLHFIPAIADADDGALGRLRAARRLRREPDGVDAVHGGDGGQVAADALHDHAARLRLRHRALPRRPRPLLGDDEPLDGRPGADHAATVTKTPAPAPERRSSRTPPKDDGASGNGASPSRRAPKPAPSARSGRRARCGARRSDEPEMSDRPDRRGDRGDGRRGEVGGVARARAAPSRARQGGGAVRGGLGRRARHARRRLRAGPGRRASAGRGAADGARPSSTRATRPATRARSSRRSSTRSASTPRSTCARTTTRSSSTCPERTSACSSAATARRSTPSSTSLNVIAHRAYGDEEKDVVVDAAGYRERRRATLESLALRPPSRCASRASRRSSSR